MRVSIHITHLRSIDECVHLLVKAVGEAVAERRGFDAKADNDREKRERTHVDDFCKKIRVTRLGTCSTITVDQLQLMW